MPSAPGASPSRDIVWGNGPDSGLCYGKGTVLRQLRVVPWLCPTLLPRVTWAESPFSGPQPPNPSNGTIPTQPCSWGSEVSQAWKGPTGLSPDGRGCWLITCCLFGPLLVPKPTFSVPFFGVGEDSDHFPTPALSSLPFSQINQSPAARVSGRPWVPANCGRPHPGAPGRPDGQLVLAAGNSLAGRFPTFRCSTTSSLMELAVSRRFGWVAWGHALGPCL